MIEGLQKNALYLYTSRPGFVIGKKGADIEKIKKIYQKSLIAM